MKKVKKVGTILVLATMAAGCYEHTYSVGTGASAVAPVVYEEWQSHWLGGLIGERTLNINEYCPSGNATIHDEQSFLNGLVTGLTGGIYAPTMVKIQCDDGNSRDLDLGENDLMTILSAPEFLDRVERMLPDRFGEAELGVRALQQQ